MTLTIDEVETNITDPLLEPIAEKVRAGARLSEEDGLQLYETPDIWTLCS